MEPCVRRRIEWLDGWRRKAKVPSKPRGRLAVQSLRTTWLRTTSPWDAADTLATKEDIAAYLDAVLEDGDPDLLKAALGDIARAKGMTEIAQAAGLGRTNLYKALSPDGNPEFATVARVLKVLGLRLSVAA